MPDEKTEPEVSDSAERHLSGTEFARLRSLLGKSQRELAGLLGISIKAVESYEQGWRRIPAHVERILFFIIYKLEEKGIPEGEDCWVLQRCPPERRVSCVAWIAKEGRSCWFFTGRLCASASSDGIARSCYSCSVFMCALERIEGGSASPRGARN